MATEIEVKEIIRKLKRLSNKEQDRLLGILVNDENSDFNELGYAFLLSDIFHGNIGKVPEHLTKKLKKMREDHAKYFTEKEYNKELSDMAMDNYRNQIEDHIKEIK